MNAIKRRSEFYASINATVQPYIIVVGDMKDSITAAYVCINDCLWKVGSVLQAVDVCFKSFFVLDAEYQAEAYGYLFRELCMILICQVNAQLQT